MSYPVKPYIFIIAHKVIPTLIFNVISMWLNATWRYPKNTYRAYEVLFRLKKEV